MSAQLSRHFARPCLCNVSARIKMALDWDVYGAFPPFGVSSHARSTPNAILRERFLRAPRRRRRAPAASARRDERRVPPKPGEAGIYNSCWARVFFSVPQISPVRNVTQNWAAISRARARALFSDISGRNQVRVWPSPRSLVARLTRETMVMSRFFSPDRNS